MIEIMARANIPFDKTSIAKERKSPRAPKPKKQWKDHILVPVGREAQQKKAMMVAMLRKANLIRNLRMERKRQRVQTMKKRKFQFKAGAKAGGQNVVRRPSNLISNRVLNAERFFKRPCPQGFSRFVVQRTSGNTAGRLDTYYTPDAKDSKILRSRPDVLKYLLMIGSPLKLDVMEFEFLHQTALREKVVTVRSLVKPAPNPTKLPKIDKEVRIVLTRIDELYPQLKEVICPPQAEEHDQEVLFIEADITPPFVMPTPKWIPAISPYDLVYEDNQINRDLWKLLTASIIVLHWQLSAYVYRFFQLFPSQMMVSACAEDMIEPAMRDGMMCEDFGKTFQLIKRFTNDFDNQQWTNPEQLSGMNPYSLAVYNVFYLGEEECDPSWYDLKMYTKWLKERHEKCVR